MFPQNYCSICSSSTASILTTLIQLLICCDKLYHNSNNYHFEWLFGIGLDDWVHYLSCHINFRYLVAGLSACKLDWKGGVNRATWKFLYIVIVHCNFFVSSFLKAVKWDAVWSWHEVESFSFFSLYDHTNLARMCLNQTPTWLLVVRRRILGNLVPLLGNMKMKLKVARFAPHGVNRATLGFS